MYIKMTAKIILLISGLFAIETIQTGKEQLFKITNIDESTIEVDISIDKLNLETINIEGNTYANLIISDSYPSTKIGFPNLPMLNKLIEIPRESNIRIEIIEDNINEYNINSIITPVQEPISKSESNKEFIINNVIFTYFT